MDVPLPFESLSQNAHDANNSDSKSAHSENHSTQQDVEKGLEPVEDLQQNVWENLFSRRMDRHNHRHLKLKLCDLWLLYDF